MGPGGIATIIAASALAVIALAFGYVIVRLGRLIDQASKAIESLVDETTPLIEEVTTTVALINGPLTSINKITKSVEEVSTKISGATETFLDKNSTAMKLASGVIEMVQAKRARSEKSVGHHDTGEGSKAARPRRTTRKPAADHE